MLLVLVNCLCIFHTYIYSLFERDSKYVHKIVPFSDMKDLGEHEERSAITDAVYCGEEFTGTGLCS